MEREFVLTPALPEHLAGIMEIENLCFAEEAFSRHQMAYLLLKAKGAFYVICRNQQIVAYICMISRSNASNLRIYSIAVHPGARGHHLATALLDKSVEYALSHQLSSITLEVDTTNKAALALYTKSGFQIITTKFGYYHNGDAYYMRKVL
jgi:[ribosomal protein S18]-alanine N-acetyltransferase